MSTINRSSKVDVWMPIYIGDYISDTMHLNTEQHGAYLLLLMTAWNRGGKLPGDEAQLALICRADKKAWARIRDLVLPFFERMEDGSLVQHRLIEEYERAVRINQKQKANGSKGGRPKKIQNETQEKPTGFVWDNPKHNPNETPSPSPISTNVDIKDKRAPRFDARAHLVSLGVPDQIAVDWVSHRRAKRSAPTQTAINGIAKEAAKAGMLLSDALSMCCERGWTGFKSDWITKDQQVLARPINGRQAAISNYAAQAAEARAHIEFPITERDITGDVVRVT